MATSGRKRIYGDPLLGYNVKYSPTQARKLRRIGNGNLSEGARQAADAHPWPMDPKPCSPGFIERRKLAQRRANS